MSGVDWNEVRDRYLPLVDKVATRGEFSDLMWEMQGELGTSHAYELGGDHRQPPAYALGFLGADLELDRARTLARSQHVVGGEPGRPRPRLAAQRAGRERQGDGDTLLAVGGQPVTPEQPPQSLLVTRPAWQWS